MPGETYLYHEGMLAVDRVPKGSVTDKVAKAAYKMYEAGLVNLVQKRVGNMKYQYWMVRR